MALSDKNIIITPNIGSANDPKIVFSGADASTAAQNITLTAYPTNGGTLSFDGSAGQLFSVTNSMSGTIFSANDVSGIPSIEVLDTGLVKVAQYSGNVLLGTGTDTGLAKLQVTGSLSITGNMLYPTNSKSIYGPNTTWSSYLYVGGDGVNGITRTGSIASVVTTNGNLHLDSGSDKGTYLNLYSGTGGIYFGNGAGGANATMSAAGVLAAVNVTIGGNQVLHANNYTSYSPTLTGGSASGTWGISVTGNAATATNATTAGGLAIHTGRNDQVNQIVRTQANGYIDCGWINTTSGDSGFVTRLTRIYASDDNYLRYLPLTDFKVSMGLSAKNNYSRRVDYTSDANYHTGSIGHSGYGANETFHGGSAFFDIWGGTNYPPSTSHIQGFNAVHYTVNSLGSTGGTAYGIQLAGQYDQGGLIFTRGCSVGSFSAWRRQIDDNNYNSYAPTLTGTGASGTWGISITGNAATATNAAGAFTVPGSLTVGNTTSSDIYMVDTDDGTRRIHCNSNRIGFLNQSDGWGSYCNDDGSWTSDFNITAYSDIKLKENIVTIDSALSKTLSLRGVFYNRIDKDDKTRKVGVIAQEIQEVLPEVVRSNYDKTDDSTTLSVDYGNISALLIEAIKEQQTIIDSQESRIARLETLVSKLIEG